MISTQLAILLDKYITETISEQEIVELFEMMKQPDNRKYIEERMLLEINEGIYDRPVDEKVKARIQLKLKNSMAGLDKERMPVYNLKRRKVWSWAAAVFVLATAGLLYFMIQTRSLTKKAPSVAVKNDIQPGKNGAILKLNDGTEVLLDEKMDGVVADQKGVVVTLDGGALKYNKGHEGTKSSALAFNTITTPRGRQFRLLLPDGSNVWLNSESSITFPVTFAANERKVIIKGELYFEVAHQQLRSGEKKPFIVTTEKGTNINVLGTHFNVNTYNDEPIEKITLFEGKVKASKSNGEWAMLKPGDQAKVEGSSPLAIDHSPNLEDALAWKEGVFFFGKKNITSIMKELSRWYNVDIKYTNGITTELFNGKISRDVPVSKVLELLQLTEQVHFKIEGNTITVLP